MRVLLKRQHLTFVLLCSSSIGLADPSREIDGVVTSAETGRPLEGVTVMTEQGDIAVTDHDGYFKIAVTEAPHALAVDLSGYVSRSVPLAGEHLQIALAPAASTGEVIEVKGKAPAQTKPLSYKLTTEEIKRLPGAGNDALRAAQILPGVARIPFGFGGLVLRGAAPADSQVYLDGIEVPLAFHFGGMTSFIPSGMLSDLSLTAGGFDTEYGRAQGGVVNLSTRAPRTDHWRVGGTMGVLDSSVVAEGPVAHGGIFIGLRHSYFDAVADPFVGNDIPLPSYWDAQIKGSFGDPARNGRISPMLILSIDQIANHPGNAEDVSALSITSMFVRGSVSYLKQWGPLSLHVQPWAGTNRLSFSRIKEGHAQTLERPEYPAGLRADLTRDTSWGHIRGGVDASSGYLSRSQIGLTGVDGSTRETTGSHTVAWTDLAVWGETRWKLAGDRFSIKPGLRAERYGLTNEVVLDPRLNIQQKIADGITARQSLGRFHQPPAPGDVDPDNGNPDLKSSYFDQAALGVDADVAEGVSMSLTGFYNYGHNLGVRTPRDASDTISPELGGIGPTFDLLLQKQLGFGVHRMNLGRGRTYGLEVMIKAHVDRYFGMLAYTLSRSERDDDPMTLTGWRPFELDQRHNLNAVGSVDLGSGWSLGGHLRLVSGNPYTPTQMVNGSLVQRPWAATLPTFFQLDLRADKRWHCEWGDVNLYLDVQNVTNRRNIEGIEFDDQGLAMTTSGLPVMPFLGVEYIPR